MKETLGKRIVKKIVSPQMAIGIGIVTAIGAASYSAIAENNADKKAEQAFPHKASPEQHQQAQQTVLIFDRTVHNLISSGESVVDAAKFTDLSRIRQAIRIIDEGNESLKQRRELRQNLQKPINERATTIFVGGVSLFFAGMGWFILRKIRREKSNNKMLSKPSV